MKKRGNPRAPRRRPPPFRLSEERIDRVIAILCRHQEAGPVARACARAGIPAAWLDRAIQAAAGRLVEAASFHRDKELGRAIRRLNALFERAVKAKGKDDGKALSVQKELNVLLGLYPKPMPARSPEPKRGAETRRPGDAEKAAPAAPPPPTAAGQITMEKLLAAVETNLEDLGLAVGETAGFEELLASARAEILRLRPLVAPSVVAERNEK